MEHSKTPWKIGTPPPNGEQTIGTTDGLMVAVTTTGYGLSSEANARRIVACINAMAGIDTAHIELSLGCGVTVLDELNRIKAQRDELLAVLESIIDLHDSASRGKQVAETIGKAHAVIATVKGE